MPFLISLNYSGIVYKFLFIFIKHIINKILEFMNLGIDTLTVDYRAALMLMESEFH